MKTAKFDVYKKNFYEFRKKAFEYGTPRIVHPYRSKEKFEMMYTALYNERKYEVEIGKRKRIGNISRLLAQQQIENHSFKQSKEIKKSFEYALEKLGLNDNQFYEKYGIRKTDVKNLKVSNIRFMSNESNTLDFFWDAVKKDYQEFSKKIDYSKIDKAGVEGQKYISNLYFGGS